MADVFVSYSRRHRDRVAPLIAALEARGWSVWWDPAIAPGQEFDRQIAEELARAAAGDAWDRRTPSGRAEPIAVGPGPSRRLTCRRHSHRFARGDLRADVRQPRRRPGAGVPERRAHRRHHHGALPLADALGAAQGSFVPVPRWGRGPDAGRVQMTDAERARRKPPASLAAYECVQRGNALPWDDPEAAAEATRLFEQAIALDPGYAMAHALLGTMRIGKWRDDPAASGEALVLTYAGPARQALDYLESARQIDPYFDPPWYWRQAGQVYMVLHRYQEALAMFAHIPLRRIRASACVAACHARLGELDRARQYVAECLAANPGFSVRQFVSKEPFRNQADADHLAESVRLAGLPE